MRRLCALLALVAGCGGVSVDKACTDAANNLCARLQACAAPLITTVYGDLATCEMRSKLTCPQGLMAPSTSETPDRLDSCASQVPMIACTDLYTRAAPPSSCQAQPGKLANGAACGTDAQCMSAFCKTPANAVCGVCGMRSAAGNSCSVNNDCDYGLACANAVCVAYGAVGATCDTNHPCGAPNKCRGGSCVTPVAAGGACDFVAQDCDATQGLYCNQQRVCAMATFAAAGQPCGIVNGAYVGCSGGARCKGATLTMPGTCLAPAADGAACDVNNGPDCLSPAQCVNSLCKLPNPATCT